MCAKVKKILYLGLDPTHYKTDGELAHWPIIRIVPRPLSEPQLHDALKRFEEYTHVIVTSKSTVAILKEYLPLLGIALNRWAHKMTLAVGHVTAKHLEACGIQPARVASEETAEGLVREIETLDHRNAHFFWPHSSKARPLIESYFVKQKIPHTSCILYDPQAQIPKELPQLADYDEIVFTSPSTIDAFLDIFGQFPSHARLTPIGPITERYLERLL